MTQAKSHAYDTGQVCVSDFNQNLPDKDGNDTEHGRIFGLNKKGILKSDQVNWFKNKFSRSSRPCWGVMPQHKQINNQRPMSYSSVFPNI